MPRGAAKEKEAPISHRPGVTAVEYALFCYLRENPSVAATYGIKQCGKSTTIGSVLRQTLQAQGMGADWYERLPDAINNEDSTRNERSAAWIKKVTRRPGQRLKQLDERPTIAPPNKAAIQRNNNGKLPLRFFEQLKGRPRRPKLSSACYNKFVAPAAVALVQRERVASFVESKLRCHCGGYVAF